MMALRTSWSITDLLDATHEKMVWAHRGVGNWYKNVRGPHGDELAARAMTRRLTRKDYVMN
jgi:hypothetical protein